MSKFNETTDKIVEGYEKIENGVVTGYKKVEDTVVGNFNKMADKFVGKFLTRDGETAEEARARLSDEQNTRKEKRMAESRIVNGSHRRSCD